jgi:FMN phosphatase YigB (HAD superfamily)
MTNIMPGILDSLIRSAKVPSVKYDAIVDSSEVGHVKPEAKIYQIAESKAGVIPSDILLIDDTRANLSAAEKAGWHVFWFDYARPIESVERILKTLEISE